MIKIVNVIPEKLVEMDTNITMLDQLNEDVGPIMQINKFNVDKEEVDQFLKAFTETAEVLKNESGFISAQLHRGIGGSCVFLNYEVWESVGDFKRAISDPKFISSLAELPPSTVMSPHLFKRVAVPGICLG